MHVFLKRAFLAAVAFMVLDGLWLGLLMTSFYRDRLGAIARLSDGRLAPDWPAALVVYVLLGVGIAAFALPRAGLANSAAAGGLLGLVVYGVYDFTNYSTLRDWPLTVALVDTAWGVAASAACAAVVWAIAR